jgi:hypothetical protein
LVTRLASRNSSNIEYASNYSLRYDRSWPKSAGRLPLLASLANSACGVGQAQYQEWATQWR